MNLIPPQIMRSEQIERYATALSKAQPRFPSLRKNRTNLLYMGAKYADFDQLVGAVSKILAKHKLVFTQLPVASESEAGVTTMIIHAPSGQYMACTLTYQLQERGPHAAASAITMAKRMSLQSMLGMRVQEEDTENQTHGYSSAKRSSPNVTEKSQQGKKNSRIEFQAANGSVTTKNGALPKETKPLTSAGESQTVKEPRKETESDQQTPVQTGDTNCPQEWRKTVIHRGRHAGQQLGQVPIDILKALIASFKPLEDLPQDSILREAFNHASAELERNGDQQEELTLFGPQP